MKTPLASAVTVLRLLNAVVKSGEAWIDNVRFGNVRPVRIKCPADAPLSGRDTEVIVANMRVTVTVYVSVVVVSCAVTTVVMVLSPMFNVIASLGLPDATLTPSTVTVALESATVGVTVVLVVEFGTFRV